MRDRYLKLLLRFRGNREPGPLKRRIGSWMLRNLPGQLTCAQFEAFVIDYHEGELPERQRAQFELHLKLCPMCAVHFDDYVRTVALGKALCEDEDRLPADMPEELVQAIVLARDAP